MKIAFISDIHANLPALEAVLKDMKKHQPDQIFCLGDLVNFACYDNEVINLIRSGNIPCLMGNHDEGIGFHQPDFPFSFKGEAQKQFGYQSIQRVNRVITDDNRRYLAELTFSLQMEFRTSLDPFRMSMVHGGVTSNLEYVQQSVSDDYLLDMMGSINADILLMGHTHIPYHKAIFCEEENRKIYRHAINVGSVGKSKDGSNNACYCLVDISGKVDITQPDAIQVSFKHVPYNTHKVIEKIREEGLSDAYNDYLLGKE